MIDAFLEERLNELKNNPYWVEIENMTNWTKVEGSGIFWSPQKENEEVEGELISKTQGKFGSVFTVMKEDGTEIVMPSHKVLQSRLERVKIPSKVKIVFLKKDLPRVKGQQGAALYDVFTDGPQEEKVD